MKKIMGLVVVGVLSMGLVACGSKKEEVGSKVEVSQENVSQEEVSSEKSGDEGIEIEESETVDVATEEEENAADDNFALDIDVAIEFGKQIKDAVAQKDMEKLADLVAYPTYIALDEGLIIENREEFIALDKEKILTDDLLKTMAATDEKMISPSRSGFVLYTEDFSPSISYTLVEGKLGINGIGY